ncbi:MAG: AIPR family protein [Dehalococcoidia bacterium]|nr:AIPR family protein [Dehalococcoidia bacterium]
MDRVSESLLHEFSEEHGILTRPEEERFEHFAASITVQRHYSETFDTDEIVTGAGGDTGIDAVAILVNGSLITDIETVEEQADTAGNLDVTFVFVQAERSSSFDGAKIGNFGFGVLDFFKETPSLQRNDRITEAAAIMAAIYKQSSKFKRGNPVCRLYYVTTGKWVEDPTLETRRRAVVNDLKETGLFREADFVPVDADGLQRLYRQTKNAIAREFNFVNRTVIPDVPGVKEAYLGFLPATDFVKLIQDDGGEIISGLFYDNVRDWLDSNPVNDEIRVTLGSEARARFVLMNNGITIIARNLQPTGNKFLIEDFSIVNGCQTSHVLFGERDQLDESVMVPIRLIGTQDENIINGIIRATNRQTEVKAEQFYALQEFSKTLELFCQAFTDAQHKLYYERRTRQYHRLPIEKTRIVTPANMIKAYAAMFLAEPHRTTRNYAALKAKVGTEIFVQGHRMEPYYAAAYALYKLEFLFRTGRLEAKYKPARFHILLAARSLANPDRLPPANSHEMERYCKTIMAILWDPTKADELIITAAKVVDSVAAGNFHRDNIRTEPFTKKVVAETMTR